MNKKLSLLLIAFTMAGSAMAQGTEMTTVTTKENTGLYAFMKGDEGKPFRHLEVGVTAGSAGIGLDIATPLSKNVKLRAGFSVMPKISFTKAYKMSTTTGLDEERIKKFCGYLSDMVGDSLHQIDSNIDMEHELSQFNAKLLVDWYPFHKKEWHFTAGFYVGDACLGRAVNARHEAPTMVAINIYNNMYDQIQKLGKYEYPTITIGGISIEMDPSSGKQVKEKFNEYGRAAVRLGEYADGTPYYLTPDANGVMEVQVETNAFKPYVGFGWQKRLGKAQQWSLGFDAGILFWGGRHITTKDGVCVLHQLTNYNDQISSYLNTLKDLAVYPNLEIRLAYTVF